MTRNLVAVHAGARLAWPFLPAAAAPGTVWLSDTGEAVMVQADGSADELGEDRRGGVAADPCARPTLKGRRGR